MTLFTGIICLPFDLHFLHCMLLCLTYFSRFLKSLLVRNISTAQKVLFLCFTLRWIIPPVSYFSIKLTSTSSLNSIYCSSSWLPFGMANFRTVMFVFYMMSCKRNSVCIPIIKLGSLIWYCLAEAHSNIFYFAQFCLIGYSWPWLKFSLFIGILIQYTFQICVQGTGNPVLHPW